MFAEDIINEILLDKDVVVKSQQMGEPEMTLEDKRSFLRDFIEQKKTSAFLYRFGSYLKLEHLSYFESRHNDEDEKYCINHHIQQLQKNLAPKATAIRNRRFGALQRLLQDKDDHFSELEMMRREPVLYEQLIGQYMTDQEKQMRDRSENPTFLSALMKGIEMEHARESTSRAIADASDDEDDSNLEEEDVPPPSRGLWGEFDDAPKERPKSIRNPIKNISDVERDELRKEFIEAMYQKFMSGNDEFNYESVDNNTEYDDLEMQDQDEQDKYFDESDAPSDEPAEPREEAVDK